MTEKPSGLWPTHEFADTLTADQVALMKAVNEQREKYLDILFSRWPDLIAEYKEVVENAVDDNDLATTEAETRVLEIIDTLFNGMSSAERSNGRHFAFNELFENHSALLASIQLRLAPKTKPRNQGRQ